MKSNAPRGYAALGVALSLLPVIARADQTPPPPPAPPSLPAGTIKVLPAKKYTLAIVGAHWLPATTLILTLQGQTGIVGIELLPRPNGTFRVGVRGPLCGDVMVNVRDQAGVVVTAHPAPRASCTSPSTHAARLTVLKGAAVHPRIVTYTDALGAELLLHVGDAVQVEGQRVEQTGDRFVVLDQRAMAKPACTGSTCFATTRTVLVAVRPGNGVLVLIPPCRAAQPPCGTPARAVNVDVLA